MEVTIANVGAISMDDLVDGVHGIYSAKDAKRSIWDIWMHANHHAAAVAEEVRKGGAPQILTELADCAMWLFTLVKKLQGEVGLRKASESEQETLIRVSSAYSDLLWRKFPGLCPMCYWRRTAGDRGKERDGIRERCDCLVHEVARRTPDEKHRHTSALRAFSEEHAEDKPLGIDAWQHMFGRIFSANIRTLELSDVTLHFLEEMGEASNALVRMYTYTESNFVHGEPATRQLRLEEELADVTSWLFAITEKLDFVRRCADDYASWVESDSCKHEPVLLSKIIWKRYGSDNSAKFVCWKCKQPLCNCPLIISPVDRSVNEVRHLIGLSDVSS